MPYTVRAQNGDTLCSVAIRHGFSNCGTLRTTAANNALLDRPLTNADDVTIPSFRGSWVYTKLATGRRWTVRWAWPRVVPQAATIRIVRKAGVAPTAVAVVNDMGISRFVPRSTNEAGADNWVDHTNYNYSGPSNADPNTFSLEINDPNVATATVRAYLEALRPTFDGHGAVNGHERFAAGAVRTARRLYLTAGQPAHAAANRYWSPELRLVVDNVDRALRPRQTLLVSDLFDAQGAGEEIQILDQDVRAVYELAACPNAEGEKCIVAWHSVPLRRGQNVEIEAWIVRDQADGTGNDNGVVTRANVLNRVRRNLRRMYAQEELSFTLRAVATIDPPSDMLMVSEPDGANATGQNPGNTAQGQVGFTITITPWAALAVPVVNVVAPIAIAGGNTPAVTAGLIAAAINHLPNLVARVSQNAPECGQPRGSADIVITCATGHATISNLTGLAQQDSAQIVAASVYNPAVVDDEQPPGQIRKGGPPMRRQLFKCQQTTPTQISVFVVNEQRGGLTTSSLFALVGNGRNVDAEVRNCMTMQAARMDGTLESGNSAVITFAHEVAHALTDADHVPATVDISLLHAGQNYQNIWWDDKRISGPGYGNQDIDTISDAGAPPLAAPMPPANHIRLVRVQTTLHALIAANGSLTFTAR